MKKLISLLSKGIVASFLMVNVSSAADCNESKAMLDKAFANAPDEMTGQYVEMAVQSCPDNAEILKRIAQYYEHWYKTDLNPEKQAEAIAGIMGKTGWTQKETGRKLGLLQPSIANKMRLLDLEGSVRSMVLGCLLGEMHARALLGLPS